LPPSPWREVDQRKANLDVTRAQQLAAEAALRNAELNLEWTQVRVARLGRVIMAKPGWKNPRLCQSIKLRTAASGRQITT
jgi:multidrug efflux pump subunit AcrA (membrane-fusion protein)